MPHSIYYSLDLTLNEVFGFLNTSQSALDFSRLTPLEKRKVRDWIDGGNLTKGGVDNFYRNQDELYQLVSKARMEGNTSLLSRLVPYLSSEQAQTFASSKRRTVSPLDIIKEERSRFLDIANIQPNTPYAQQARAREKANLLTWVLGILEDYPATPQMVEEVEGLGSHEKFGLLNLILGLSGDQLNFQLLLEKIELSTLLVNERQISAAEALCQISKTAEKLS